MATAADVMLPLRPGLVPMPAAGQPGVCQFCHGACSPEYRQCSQCLDADRSLGAVDVLPVSMAVGGGLFHRHLRGYKDDRREAVRARMAHRLAALATVFLVRHADCVGPFDSVVLAPSPTRTAVESIVVGMPLLRGRYRPGLRATGLAAKNELRGDRFAVIRDVTAERVLMLDDTFTSGASLFGAVAALRAAGAEIAGPVVLGRYVRPDWGPSRELLSWLRTRTWSDERCCRSDGEWEQSGRLL